MRKKNSKIKNNNDIRSRIIKKQTDEIESLKQTILNLEIDCEKKDELINLVDRMRSEMLDVVNEIKVKSREYDALINDLKQMKKAMNEDYFKGRWNLVRLLLK